MVKIRLKRMGNKFNAFYRIVIAEALAPRDGRFIEEIGYFNPHSKELKIDKDLAMKWLKQGAQPTEIVKNLFKKEKIWSDFMESKKTTKKPKTKKAKKSSSKSTTKKKTSTKKTTTKKTTKTKKEEN